jgi:hypothetical protein
MPHLRPGAGWRSTDSVYPRGGVGTCVAGHECDCECEGGCDKGELWRARIVPYDADAVGRREADQAHAN